MPTLNLLYKRRYAINDKISIEIPSVGDVLDDEDNYYNIVSILTAVPMDFMVQLDDAGIDFTTINEYELFLLTFTGLRDLDTHLVFGDLDLTNFVYEENPQNGNIVLVDHENDICIDRALLGQIAATLRKIHHLKKNNRKPANEDAKKYLLQRAREKMRRRKNRLEESQLESLIIALVNTEEFKYDFDGARDISIYQFNESVRQIVNKVDYNNRMYGIYSGTVDPKKLSQDELTWLTHK